MNLKQFPKRLDSKTSCLRISVPENLDLALEGLIRKVLREQPKTDDIYSFAADYFETLLKIRDKAGANFTAAQLCPFHNDEDAHEMIKLAGTFSKPEKFNKSNEEVSRTGRKKDARRPKPKQPVRGEKITRQSAADLVKKLPTRTKTNETKEAKPDERKSEAIEEKIEIDGEFLTSDPIKELVEKELMMEAKANGKKAAGDVRSVELDKESEQEKRKTVDARQEIKEESEPKAISNEIKEIENHEEVKIAETNAEEQNKEEGKKETPISAETPETKEGAGKAEVLKTPPEEANKDEAVSSQQTSQNVESSEGENKQTINVSKSESQPPTQERLVKKEESEKSAENSKNTVEDEFTPKEGSNEENKTEIKNVETSDIQKHEEKVQNATGEQRQEAEIDKETKATGENTSKTAVETLPVARGSSSTSPTETNRETKTNEETADEHKRTQNPNEIEITKEVFKEQENNLRDVTLNEEPTRRAEDVKEALADSESEHKNEEKPLTSPESRDDKEVCNTSLETLKDKAADVENKNEEREEGKADGGNEKPESSKPDEAKRKEEKKFSEEENLESETSPGANTSEIAQSDKMQENKETTTPDDEGSKNRMTAEPVMETQKTQTDEQKPKEESRPSEHPQGKENRTEEKSFDVLDSRNAQTKEETEIRKTEDIQSEVDKSPEPEKLCSLVDVESTLENKTKEEITQSEEEEKKQGELHAVNKSKEPATEVSTTEKTENGKVVDKGQNTEGKTEEFLAVVDVKNIPETPKTEKKEEITQNKEDNASQQELCAVVDVENIPNEDLTDDDKTKDAEKDLTEEDTTKDEKTTAADVENKSKGTTDEYKTEKAGETSQNEKDVTNAEELCRVVDVENIPKQDTTKENQTLKAETIDNVDDKATNPEDLNVEADVKNIPEKVDNEKEEEMRSRYKKTNSELSAVTDESNTPKEGTTDENKTEKLERKAETDQNKEGATNSEVLTAVMDEIKTEAKPEIVETEPPDIVEPDKVLNPEEVQLPEEFQIKTIQTHYYDTLQVPRTVTKEYIVHNMVAPPINPLLGVANSLQQTRTTDESMNAPPPIESTNVSSPTDTLKPEKQVQTNTAEVENQREVETTTQTSDSDDLLDIMTPTSGYSLNLSEISWQTVSEMFLDSERRYSSLEKEEVKYATVKTGDQTRQEVEEVIRKTVIPTRVDAVPVPPRDADEIQANADGVKENKEEKPEGESEGSTESRGGDGDVPFISVEVKTVIETQVLDEEEEVDGERRRPGVEVTVEATIDIQDDVGMPPQSEPDTIEEENKISNGKGQEVKSGLEGLRSTSQDEQRKESSSTEQTTGKGSSGESDSTLSSAATEIKRTDSAKRNFDSARSLLSTQSLDLGKRNPLLKTRSLSTFRHGVTDFEVWNAIERELEEAATKIQSKFRGYKTRKKLQRENAVQITTEESSPSTTPAEAEAKEEGQQSTGEFHDSIVLAEHPR